MKSPRIRYKWSWSNIHTNGYNVEILLRIGKLCFIRYLEF